MPSADFFLHRLLAEPSAERNYQYLERQTKKTAGCRIRISGAIQRSPVQGTQIGFKCEQAGEVRCAEGGGGGAARGLPCENYYFSRSGARWTHATRAESLYLCMGGWSDGGFIPGWHLLFRNFRCERRWRGYRYGQ